jgi:multiple sugar transport system permease protein
VAYPANAVSARSTEQLLDGPQKSSRAELKTSTILWYTLVVMLLLVYLVPVFWNVSTSLRTNRNLNDPTQWIPNPMTLQHYSNLFEFLPDWPLYLVNTLRIAVLSTVGRLLSCSMAGYALARLRFPGRGPLMFILLLTLMIPGQVTLVPTFSAFQRLGWINTPWPLIVPAFFGDAFGTFFFRQFFMTIPKELEEAAMLDGAGRWRVYWSIILPLSKPALIAIGTLTFVGAWNGFFGPSIYLRRDESWVLTQALTFLTGQYSSEWGEIMAGTILMSLPMIILFMIGQRFFVRGITFTGLKG